MKDHVPLTIGLRALSGYFGRQIAAIVMIIGALSGMALWLAPKTATVDEVATFVVVLCSVHLVANRLAAPFVKSDDLDEMFDELIQALRRGWRVRVYLFALILPAGISLTLAFTALACVPIYQWLEMAWAANAARKIALGFGAILLITGSCLLLVQILPGKRRRLLAPEIAYGGASAMCAQYALPTDFVGLLLSVRTWHSDRRHTDTWSNKGAA